MRLSVSLLVLFAGCCGQVWSYSRYYYHYAPPLSADAYYSGMSDIDWSKRSGYDNWISPAYSYSSMADHDWGWKKRADYSREPEDDAEDDGDDASSKNYYGFFNSYDPSRWQRYYRPYQPTTKASSSSSSSSASNSRNGGGRTPIALASRSFGGSYRSPVRDDSYNYVGMADLDWGWKKRKRSGAAMKRHIGSLPVPFKPTAKKHVSQA